MANIMALACSAAFPTIGSKITLIKETGILHATEAPCEIQTQTKKIMDEIVAATCKTYYIGKKNK